MLLPAFRIPLLLAALASYADAFFRINCANINVGRIDSIVSPGKVSAHVHTIQGGANFGVSATNTTLLNSACSSCEVQDDRSAYWTPLLYYQFPNGSLIDVKQTGSVLYYIGRGVNMANIVPFPPGFRMISGDAGARSYDNTTLTWGNATYGSRPVADRVSWACLSTKPSAETHGINNTDCYAGLRAQIHFQSCWNGVDVYKPDNSHVAYMSQIDNGACPPTHPVQLAHLFIETSYQVNALPKVAGGRLVLSTGDPTGYSFHADFQNGWNQTTLARAMKSCISNPGSSGDLKECPVLMESQIDAFTQRCPIRPSPINETVTGLLPKLPGCINIVDGPARAQPSDMNCPSTVQPPAIVATQDTAPVNYFIPTPGQPAGLPNWVYTGCSNDSQPGRVLSADGFSNSSVTVEGCQRYCAAKGYKYAGLELGNQCFCDNYLLSNPVFNAGAWILGKCYYACAGNATQYCGGQARVDVYNLTSAAQLPLPSTQPQSGTYVAKGCWKENSGSGRRALADFSTSANTMTVDACAKFCLGKSMKWFGVEYGRECYCGSSLNSTGGQVALSACNIRCAGNSGQTQSYCGGSSLLNVYYSGTL